MLTRTPALLPFALLLSGCLAPGERDPTRYPWDPRNAALAPHAPVVAHGAIPPLAAPQQKFVPPQGSYCIVALQAPSNSGIVVGGKAPGILTCTAPATAPAPH